MISENYRSLILPKHNHSVSLLNSQPSSKFNLLNNTKTSKAKLNRFLPKQFYQSERNPLKKQSFTRYPEQCLPENQIMNFKPQTSRDYYAGSSSPIRRPKLLLNNEILNNKTHLRETNSTQCQSPKIVLSKQHQKIRQYQILKLLGKGKYGQVYLSKHEPTGFLGALKIIKKSDLLDEFCNKNNKIVNQLINEIKIQSFSNHPNLIKIYDFFSDQDHIFLFLELAPDGQLFDMLQNKGTFSEEATSLIVRQIGNGIQYLHSKSIIHRDIKLENIVFTHGMAKICDFGCAVYQPREFRKTLCGTPLYLSPQVLQGRKYNEKIDIWALGTLAYEMLTNENPFKIENKEQLNKIITTDFQMKVGSPQIRSFVNFILKKNPCKRPDAEIILKHPFINKYIDIETSDQICNCR